MISEPSLPTNRQTLPVRGAVFDLLRELEHFHPDWSRGVDQRGRNPSHTQNAVPTRPRRMIHEAPVACHRRF
jgi:hypothetical protein